MHVVGIWYVQWRVQSSRGCTIDHIGLFTQSLCMPTTEWRVRPDLKKTTLMPNLCVVLPSHLHRGIITTGGLLSFSWSLSGPIALCVYVCVCVCVCVVDMGQESRTSSVCMW